MPRPQKNKKGLLIAFDGLDSSGKATQVRELIARLEYAGQRVRHFQSPDYTTSSGQELKSRLQGALGDWSTTPWEEKMRLFAANRAEHKEEVLAAIAEGTVVVYDRYVASSLAFITIEALSAQEVDLYRAQVHETIKREEYTKQGMPRENIALFLDVPPSVAATLLNQRQQHRQDEAEYTDQISLQERLYNEYDHMITQDAAHWLRIQCVEGTQLLGIADVSELVWEGLINRFPRLTKKT